MIWVKVLVLGVKKDLALLTCNTDLTYRENGCLSMSKGRKRLCSALISGGATSVTSDPCCRPDTEQETPTMGRFRNYDSKRPVQITEFLHNAALTSSKILPTEFMLIAICVYGRFL